MNTHRSSLLFCFPKTSRFADGKKLSVVCNVWQSIKTKLSTTFFGVKTKQTGKKYAYHMLFFARKYCYHYFKSDSFGQAFRKIIVTPLIKVR